MKNFSKEFLPLYILVIGAAAAIALGFFGACAVSDDDDEEKAGDLLIAYKSADNFSLADATAVAGDKAFSTFLSAAELASITGAVKVTRVLQFFRGGTWLVTSQYELNYDNGPATMTNTLSGTYTGFPNQVASIAPKTGSVEITITRKENSITTTKFQRTVGENKTETAQRLNIARAETKLTIQDPLPVTINDSSNKLTSTVDVPDSSTTSSEGSGD